MALKSKSKPKHVEPMEAEKYPLPDNTCPFIDLAIESIRDRNFPRAIEQLEELRASNDALRSAAHKYHRHQREMAQNSVDQAAENNALRLQNARLQITRNWIEDLDSGVLTVTKEQLIGITLQRDELLAQKNEFSVTNLVAIFNKLYKRFGSGAIRSMMPVRERIWIAALFDKEEARVNKLRAEAYAKLTDAERKAIGLKDPSKKASREQDEDDDEESDDED